ncbi:hypothetical protein I4U23_025316 [Adineta vaga]|nr:hypothetical protein I4U23_025316 [Adineta vaga]
MENAMSQTYVATFTWFSKLQYFTVDGMNDNRYSRRMLRGLSPSISRPTVDFHEKVVPILRRIKNIEELKLCFRVRRQNSFIDGNYLSNEIVCHLPRLHEFTFDIISDQARINVYPKPTSDDIRRTFVENGYCADCYIDHNDIDHTIGRYHIYSLPYMMKRIQYVTSGFPGDIFTNVRVLRIWDIDRSFENSFFVKISRSFPLLHQLSVSYMIERIEKQRYILGH